MCFGGGEEGEENKEEEKEKGKGREEEDDEDEEDEGEGEEEDHDERMYLMCRRPSFELSFVVGEGFSYRGRNMLFEENNAPHISPNIGRHLTIEYVACSTKYRYLS